MMERGYLFLPLVGIIYFLVEGSTPIKAALYGLGLAILASFIRKDTRLSIKDFLEALENGARGALGVSIKIFQLQMKLKEQQKAKLFFRQQFR
jgi:TRAP-type uncharacterized transport system fused permease subunit